MIDILLITVLIILIVLHLFPIIEGNSTNSTSDALQMSEKSAAEIQYIQDQYKSILDTLDSDLDDAINTASEDNAQNTQNIADYMTATGGGHSAASEMP